MGGSGWRKAFCTSSVTRDKLKLQHSPSSYSRLKFFSTTSSSSSSSTTTTATTLSNPATPRSSEIKNDAVVPGPALRCRTALKQPTSGGGGGGGTTITTPTPTTTGKSPMPSPRTPVQQHQLQPCSPRSPSRFSLLKNSIRLSKSRCGVCLQSAMAVHGTAIFIAECSHSFHFACIAAHVQTNNTLVCPVCAAMWRHVPGLAVPERPAEKDRGGVGGGGWNGGNGIENGRWGGVVKKERVVVGRGYSDDEPLRSPGGSVTCFNPIMEVEAEDEDGGDEERISDNEFQGFFATNRQPSASPGEIERRRQREDDGVSTAAVDITVEPEIALLSNGRNHDKYVVPVKVKALPSPASSANGIARAPIDLVVVVDVGGVEMNGVKLQMLKRCIRQVIGSLTSTDRLSVVVFASTAKRLVPLQRMTPQSQRSTRRIVDRIVSGNSAGGRIVGDALRKATRILEDRRERNPVASIMFLADGQHQQSQSEKGERIPSSSSSLSCRSSSTTSSAGTRFAHIEIPLFSSKDDKTTEPPEEAFARCVGRLHSVVVQDVALQLQLASGEITAVYAVGSQTITSTGGTGSVNFGDLYADEERDFLVEIRIPSSLPQFSLVANCNYKDPLNQEAVVSDDRSLLITLPISVTPRNYRRQRKPMNAKAETVRNLFVTTRAVTEARRLTGLNDTGTALHLLSSARALLLQSTESSAVENLRVVEAELADLQLRRQRRNRSERDRETAVTPVAVGTMENGVGGIGAEALTPTSAWRAAERLAKLAVMKKSLNRVSDLHGFEDARF